MEGFWDDSTNASKIQKEKSVIEEIVNTYLHLKQLYDDFDVLLDFALTENDEASAVEAAPHSATLNVHTSSSTASTSAFVAACMKTFAWCPNATSAAEEVVCNAAAAWTARVAA